MSHAEGIPIDRPLHELIGELRHAAEYALLAEGLRFGLSGRISPSKPFRGADRAHWMEIVSRACAAIVFSQRRPPKDVCIAHGRILTPDQWTAHLAWCCNRVRRLLRLNEHRSEDESKELQQLIEELGDRGEEAFDFWLASSSARPDPPDDQGRAGNGHPAPAHRQMRGETLRAKEVIDKSSGQLSPKEVAKQADVDWGAMRGRVKAELIEHGYTCDGHWHAPSCDCGACAARRKSAADFH